MFSGKAFSYLFVSFRIFSYLFVSFRIFSGVQGLGYRENLFMVQGKSFQGGIIFSEVQGKPFQVTLFIFSSFYLFWGNAFAQPILKKTKRNKEMQSTTKTIPFAQPKPLPLHEKGFGCIFHKLYRKNAKVFVFKPFV